MRLKELLKKTAVTACAAAMVVTLIAGNGVVAKAEEAKEAQGATEATTATTTDYTIDTNKAAKLTIHKFQKTDDNGTTEGTGKVDTGITGTPIQGAVFSYKKVAGIDMQTITDANGTAKLVYTIDTTLAAILKKADSSTQTEWTSDELNAGLAAAVADPTYKTKLETYMSGASTITTVADGTASADITKDDLGLYLVVETAMPNIIASTTAPFFVSLPMTDSKAGTTTKWNYDVHVYPKNQVDLPEINKIVKDDDDSDYTDTTTVSEGDVIDYIIITKVPVTAGSDVVKLDKFVFTDELAAGLKYVGTTDTTNVKVDIHFTDTNTAAAAKTALATEAWAAANYTAVQANNKMTITAIAAGITDLNTAERSGKYMVVHYQATVQSAASTILGETGNANKATLTYSRQGQTGDTAISDKAVVYTYGLKLTKKFSDNNGTATNVKFTLKNTSNGTSGEEIYATGSEGVYYVCAKADGATNEFSPKADGTLVINGLEADTYELTETQTDTGYSLLKEKITIVVGATTETITAQQAVMNNGVLALSEIAETGKTTAASSVSDTAVTLKDSNGSANAIVPLEVINTKSFTLPMTGGAGAIIFTVLGAIAIGGAIVVISRNKKRA